MIIDNSKLDKNSVFFLTGMSNHKIEDLLIKDVQFIVAGGGTKEDAVKTVNSTSMCSTGRKMANCWCQCPARHPPRLLSIQVTREPSGSNARRSLARMSPI
jgi:hypothetical protein